MNRFKVMELVKNLLLAVAMVAFGVLVIIFAENDAALLTTFNVFKYAFLAIGAYMIVNYFVNFKAASNASSLILGAFLIIADVAIILLDIEFILYFIGLVVALAGAYYLGIAFDQKQKGDKAWWKDLISAIVFVVVGVGYYLAFRYIATINIFILVAIVLLAVGVYKCIATFALKK